MASFDKYTNYKNNAGVSGVVFGADKTVLEVELNEMQEIEKFGLRNMLAKIVGDGITDRSKLTYDNGAVKIASGCGLLVNGILVNCSGLSLTMSSGIAYLQVWEETVSYSDTLKKDGNQQDTDTVTNWAKDDRSDVETSRRKVVKYTLATSQKSDANNIAIASVASGVMTKLVNEVNLTNLTNKANLKLATSGNTAMGEIMFGKDGNGKYGYIPEGADTVIPFKSGGTLKTVNIGTFNANANANSKTFDITDIEGWQDFTTDNFAVGISSFSGHESGSQVKSESVSIAYNYNSSTGILSITLTINRSCYSSNVNGFVNLYYV